MLELWWVVLGALALVSLPFIGHYWQKRSARARAYEEPMSCARCAHDDGLAVEREHCGAVIDDGWGPTPCVCDADYHFRVQAIRSRRPPQ